MKSTVFRCAPRGVRLSGMAAACAASVAALVLAACSAPVPGAIDYQSTTPKTRAPSLAAPPDLINEAHTERALPPAQGDTTLDTYQRIEAATPVAAPQGPDVLPQTPGITMQRDGTQRWLVVQNGMTVDQVWSQLRKFWQEQGFLLTVDSRDRLIMETDWQETHPTIDQGIIRNTLTRAMNNMYTTGERHRYRTRLETGSDGKVYVFISETGLAEQLTGTNNDGSQWVDRPNDPLLEAIYLGRLQREIALSDAQARGVSLTGPQSVPTGAPPSDETPSAAPVTAPVAAPAAVATVAMTQSAQPSGNGLQDGAILLPESYDRAWLRIGLALDRANFTVDNRDPVKGIYTLRYVDPAEMGTAGQGFWSQLFHGKREKTSAQYMVNVRALTQNSTRVAVVDAHGQVQTSRQALAIMSLIADQL